MLRSSRMSNASEEVGTFSRRRKSTEPQDPVRQFGNRLFTALCRALFGVPLHDVLNGGKAFRREVFLVARPERRGQEHDVELVLKAHRAGFRLADVAIQQGPRLDGESKLYPWRHGLRILSVILREWMRPPRPTVPRHASPRQVRCVFVHAQADSYIDHKFGGKFAGPRFAPIWAYTLAAHVPEDGRFAVALHDTQLTPMSALPEGDLFLFSGLNQDLASIVETREAIARRYPSAVFAVGGPITSSFDHSGDLDRLAAFDHICIGEGETLIGPLVESVWSAARLPKVLRPHERFDLQQSRPLHTGLARQYARNYYGGLVEVSRGCPFLCEFCDVRTAPDNNRPHNRPPETIIQDLDFLSRIGIRQFQLVCDNLIGDPRWAELLLDRIIEWEQRTGFRPGLYTWATLNLRNYPVLMRKMRLAGVDMLNIGVESFDRNALLETAKVQNAPAVRGHAATADSGVPNYSTVEAVREIQSYGLVIAAGLIFGFDSDTEASFDVALQGIRESGVLSGDPHLLTALPGTPLYRRMKLAGRLRTIHSGLGIRYQTNIRYLLPRRVMADGLMRFLRGYADGAYQYARLVQFFGGLSRGNLVPFQSATYFNPTRMLGALLANPVIGFDYLMRIAVFASSPRNVLYALRGVLFVASQRGVGGRSTPLQLWLLMWMNSASKVRSMRAEDLDIEDVGSPLTRQHILPDAYAETASEPIPLAKIRAQLHYTTSQLLPLAERLPQR